MPSPEQNAGLLWVGLVIRLSGLNESRMQKKSAPHDEAPCPIVPLVRTREQHCGFTGIFEASSGSRRSVNGSLTVTVLSNMHSSDEVHKDFMRKQQEMKVAFNYTTRPAFVPVIEQPHDTDGLFFRVRSQVPARLQ